MFVYIRLYLSLFVLCIVLFCLMVCLFFCFCFLNLKPEMRSSKYGSKCGCLCLHAFVRLLTCDEQERRVVCLLVFPLVSFLFYGEYRVGQCVSALSVCYWNVQSLTSMSQTKPTKQHHRSHSSEPPLIWTSGHFYLKPVFLFCLFFYIVNFLHWQSILELKSWVWSYYLFDSLVWWHNLMT